MPPPRSGGLAAVPVADVVHRGAHGPYHVRCERAGRTEGRRHHPEPSLDTVLDRVEGCGSPAYRVWLPPLAESPELALLDSGGAQIPLTAPIGLVDSPFEQRRDLLVAQLAGAAGNVAVVGGPRSGKSTALRTLILALARAHDPGDVQFYCLDFGGGALSALLPLPHIGSVAGRRDADLVRRTIAQFESLATSTRGPA